MEPLSATASILGVVDVALRTTTALFAYLQDTKNATINKKLLAEEVSSLLHVLERLHSRILNKNQDQNWNRQQKDLVHTLERACDDLAKLLNFDVTTGKMRQEGRLRRLQSSSMWSFNKSEVYSILERIARLQQYANTLLLDDQSVLLQDIYRGQQEVNEEHLRSSILRWLCPFNMVRTHQSVSSRVPEGSGRWFLEAERFADWRSGRNKLLWCSGIRKFEGTQINLKAYLFVAGAGKTVIAFDSCPSLRGTILLTITTSSIVAEHLFREQRDNKIGPNVGIAVVYLKYNDPEQTLNNILGSLSHQLLQSQQQLPASVQRMYECYKNSDKIMTLDDISQVYRALVGAQEEVFVIIDALDECSDETRWGLMEKLRYSGSDIRLFITSRFQHSINAELEDFKRLEIEANKTDIELFIDEQIQRNRSLRVLIEKKPSMREDMKTGVVQTADKMFLLARLHVEGLASAATLSIRHVRDKLRTLPTTLVDTYDEAVQRIATQGPEKESIAMKILAWITCAFRPLMLKELQHALAIEQNTADLDEELVIEGQNMIALCAGLVVVDPHTEAVTLVHYTTKKYFEDYCDKYFPNFHGSITMSCATYLAMPVLQNSTVRRIARDHPLACYAAQYMADHARKNPEESLEVSTLDILHQLLSQPSKRMSLILLLDSLDLIKSGFYTSKQPISSDSDNERSTITAGSSQGVSNRILETQDDLVGGEKLASLTNTPKNAIAADEAIIVSSKISERKGFALQRNVRAKKVLEVTALHLAASLGLVKVASMLLMDISDIDAVDQTGKTALVVAMERGFEKAVEFLVRSGAQVDLSHEHGQGIFLFVAEKNWTNVADMIAKRALATALEDFSVCLLTATYYGEEKQVFHLLHEATAEPSDRNNVGEMALFLAVERDCPNVVQVLLSAGVDVDSKDSIGQTSLHRATRRGSERLIRILFENGAKADILNDDGRTAWSANINSKNERILQLLLDKGADPNTRGHNGVSELYPAAAGGNTEVVKLMLKSGTNPSIKTAFDWAPLHWAAYCGHNECVKLLIEAGADLNQASDQDKTPLDLAISTNKGTTVDILTSAGAKRRQDMAAAKCNSSVEYFKPTAHDGKGSGVKLLMTFDQPLGQTFTFGQFIYVTNDNASEKFLPYQLSSPLNCAATSMDVKHCRIRPEMGAYPLKPDLFNHSDILYNIVPVGADYLDFRLQSTPETELIGTIQVRRVWTGSWTAQVEHAGMLRTLFRTTPDWSQAQDSGCRWIAEDGRLLARTTNSTVSFDQSIDCKLFDALVACWIAKLWSEALTYQNLSISYPKQEKDLVINR